MLAKSVDIYAEVMSILRCPSCRGMLREQEGGLSCPGCRSFYRSRNGTVRFVDNESYAGNFGFEWHKYAQTQLDQDGSCESEVGFCQKTGFSPEEIRGKLVLDVGCGTGRFAEVASRWGARVVGIDLSSAAEVAARNLANRKSVTIFQADIFALPFAPESFDFIYSIGVLHHTPDCAQAFKVLPSFLKPGGSIAIWLYSGYHNWYRFSDLYRKVTHRLPARWLHALCHVATPFYYFHRGLRWIPLVGPPLSGLVRHLFPVSLNPNPDVRILDTFDWYSPKYQSKHTYEQVFRWFESCGLESIRVLGTPVAVRGSRPRSSEVNCELPVGAVGQKV
jgi:SAM-dependent methyltransferase